MNIQISVPALIALAFGMAALVHVLLHWWVRRNPHFAEIARPLAILIWIQALYFAVSQLLGETSEGARSVLSFAYGLAIVAALSWCLWTIGRLVEAFLRTLAGRTESRWDDVMLEIAGRAVRRLLPLLALILAAPALAVSAELEQMLTDGASLVFIGVVAFILVQVVDLTAALLLEQHRLDVQDNVQARAVHTQVLVLKKVAVTVIGVFTLASMLMVFESARQFGASILASAGIAGIIIGFAAQRSIATLLAGFQIALTQPIRVDDVVVVENEWGRIEDITLTYVVVRIWDLRRLVLPITYFIEQPFQNWTRSTADILGTVFLQVDYSVPLDALRAELTAILAASPRWDGRVNVLQVTDAKEHTIEVRALASAADASLAWDLRCEIREKLIQFLQRQYPDSLPRVRASLEPNVLGAT
jgi:small-conductance mechanosensitive channel